MRFTVHSWLFLFVAAFLSISSPLTTFAADTGCTQYIETPSAKQLSKELGKPEKWVSANHRFKLFDKETSSEKGKGKVVGRLAPGARAEILKTSADSYQVKSPSDGAVGWINRRQVRHTLLLDTKTLKPCR